MNAVCLVIDRLHAGYVGAYGNTWIETPALDRLASRSLLLDQALVDSPDLERLYRSYWQGWHALCRQEPPESRPSLAAMLRDAGVTTAPVDRRAAGRPAPAGRGFRGVDRDRPPLAAADRRGNRPDALRPLLRRDDRVAAIGPRPVPVVVPPRRLGHHVGRADAVPPGVSGAGRSAAAGVGRRARPDAPARPRPGRVAGHRPGVCRPGDVVGHVSGGVLGFPRRAARQRRDPVDALFGPRLSAGRARPRGGVRRRALRRIAPGPLDDPVPRRGRRRRAESGPGRAGGPLGDAAGLVGRARAGPRARGEGRSAVPSERQG